MLAFPLPPVVEIRTRLTRLILLLLLFFYLPPSQIGLSFIFVAKVFFVLVVTLRFGNFAVVGDPLYRVFFAKPLSDVLFDVFWEREVGKIGPGLFRSFDTNDEFAASSSCMPRKTWGTAFTALMPTACIQVGGWWTAMP